MTTRVPPGPAVGVPEPVGEPAPDRPADTVVDPALPVTDRGAAEAYVASVCFKHGPPRLVGVELEWLVRHDDDPTRPLDPAALVRALGPHTPATLAPPAAPSPAASVAPAPLPHGGTVTVEPGGQVEIASPPADSLAALVSSVRADAAELTRRLAAEGLALVRRGADPLRPPRRLLEVPRYAAMEAAFDRIGPSGRTMMCSTASVQVCVDAGEGGAVGERWAALHELGPVLTAVFANSAAAHGRRTGLRSTRFASWLTLDPERTRPPGSLDPDPAVGYARRALDTSLLCVRRDDDPDGSWCAPPAVSFGDWIDGHGGLDRAPTRADLDYHLTTLFPPVRPQGHLEVRYLDQQAGDEWDLPVAVVAGLCADPAALDAARAAAAPTVGRWWPAVRDALTDPVLARAAREVVDLAVRALPATGPDARLRERVERTVVPRVERGLCPADLDLHEPGERTLAPTETAVPDPGHPRPAGGEPR